MMKVGDLIVKRIPGLSETQRGIVLDFPLATHAKQHQKVKVLSEGQVKYWTYQFCEVLHEIE